MRRMHWALILSLLAIAGCTWVETTESGQQVRLATQDQVAKCKKLGKTTVSVMDKVGFISRSEEKVAEELQALAKNSAAEMEGDTVVASSAVSNGEQSFDVYRCRH